MKGGCKATHECIRSSLVVSDSISYGTYAADVKRDGEFESAQGFSLLTSVRDKLSAYCSALEEVIKSYTDHQGDYSKDEIDESNQSLIDIVSSLSILRERLEKAMASVESSAEASMGAGPT